MIYKAEYWDRCYGDQIQCQDLANILVDFFVQNPIRAARLLQSVINQLSLGSHIPEDGVIGPHTIAALAGVNQAQAYRLYRAQRIEQYEQIAAANPSEQVFLAGWIARVSKFPEVIQS